MFIEIHTRLSYTLVNSFSCMAKFIELLILNILSDQERLVFVAKYKPLNAVYNE
jgi:hypothetical protein